MAYPSDLVFYAKYNSTFDSDFPGTNYEGLGSLAIETLISKYGAGCLYLPTSSAIIYDSGGNSIDEQGTISLWGYWPSGSPTWASLFRIGLTSLSLPSDPGTEPVDNWINLGFSRTGMGLVMYSSGGNLTAIGSYATALAVDIWHHFVLRFDTTLGSNQVRIYVDTQIDTDSPNTFTFTGPRTPIANVYLTGVNSYGYVDDVRFYNTDRLVPNSEEELFGSTAYLNFGAPFAGGYARGFGR